MDVQQISQPSISIVVPSFNHRPWIADCIKSILNQKSSSDQLIVIDGDSNDGTREILQRYAQDIDELIIEPDSGQSDALHKGFALAKGDILAYLNSDDILLSDTFSFVREYFQKHLHIDAIYGNRIFIDEKNNPIGNWVIPFHSSYCHKRWDYIPQESCFWRKSLMDKTGSIDPELQFAMDYDLFIRMMETGSFKHVHRYFACFRNHPDSKTNTIYDTIGKTEIHTIQQRYGIKLHWYDRFVGHAYGQLVLNLGKLVHAARRLTGNKLLAHRIEIVTK